jgi:hypothetical protein
MATDITDSERIAWQRRAGAGAVILSQMQDSLDDIDQTIPPEEDDDDPHDH